MGDTPEPTAAAMKAEAARDILAAECRRIVEWLERQAEHSAKAADNARHESLVEAFRGDVRNYRATANRIRASMTEAGAKS